MDSYKAYEEDKAEYIRLCKKYHEKVQYKKVRSDMAIDCYGDHCEKLKEKEKYENRRLN